MNNKKHLIFFKVFIFIIVILSGLYLRYLLLNIPLSYDEGDWAYITTRLLKGKQLYIDTLSANPPIVFVPFLISEVILGHGFGNLRLIGSIWNIVTIVLMYFLAKTVFNKRIAFYTLLLALIYTLSYRQEGMFILLTEHLSQLPVFISVAVMVFALKSGKDRLYFTSGIFMSLAWNIRPHYIILNLLLVVYLIAGKFLKKLSGKQVFLYIFGSMIPFLVILFYLYVNHSLKSFIVEVYLDRIKYNIAALDYKIDFYILWDRTKNIIFLFILTFFSFLYLFRAKNKKYLYFCIYLVFTANIIILISTGNRYYNHYFLYLTYGVLILSAVGLDFIFRRLKKTSAIVFYLAVFLTMNTLFIEYSNNLNYLINFNNYEFKKNYYTNTIINYKLLNSLKIIKINERILFLGLSVPNYYYLNRGLDEKVSSSLGLYLHFHNSDKDKEWVDWFEEIKAKPAAVIVSDFATHDDIFLIPEFRQFVSDNYYFAEKMNQHYILKLKKDAPGKI